MNYTIKTEGLHCGHCAAAVETELMKVPGVLDADANHETNTVSVECEGPVDEALLEAAVAGAGEAFKVVSITAA